MQTDTMDAKKNLTRVLIIGAGEVGFHTARRLSEENKQVVIVDVCAERLRRLQDSFDVQTIQGSGSSPQVLKDAGIDEADIILAVTDSDEVNIVSCLFASALAPHAVKLARVRNPEYENYPKLLADSLHFNLLVNPEVEIVRSIERLLTLPGAVEYSEFANRRINMVGMRLENGPLINQPLSHFRSILHDEGIMVGAIVRQNTLLVPSGSDVMQKGDIVYFVYRASSLPILLRSLNTNREFVHSVCIYGGNRIGQLLAMRLERKGILVKLFEPDAMRCRQLADELDSTLVLNGEGTDKALLEEERVGTMDAFVALTNDQESNMLAAVLAKSMGAKSTVAMVDKPEYLPLVEAMGIDHSVSSRISAVNSILQYIRRGRVLASVSVGQEAAEAIEAVVAPGTRLDGNSVSKLGLPKGVLLLAVTRADEVLIPTGKTITKAGDRVLLLADRQKVSAIEHLLSQPVEESL